MLLFSRIVQFIQKSSPEALRFALYRNLNEECSSHKCKKSGKGNEALIMLITLEGRNGHSVSRGRLLKGHYS